MSYLTKLIETNPNCHIDILVDIRGKETPVEGVATSASENGVQMLVLTSQGFVPLFLPDENILGFRTLDD